MTEWPKCTACKTEIGNGEPFVVVEHDPIVRILTVAHERCITAANQPKSRVRSMNEARAWVVREYSVADPIL